MNDIFDGIKVPLKQKLQVIVHTSPGYNDRINVNPEKFKLKILLCAHMTVKIFFYLSSGFLENVKYTHLHTSFQRSHPHKCKCTYLPHHCRLHH